MNTKYWLNIANEGANPVWEEISLPLKEFLKPVGTYETSDGNPPQRYFCLHCGKAIYKGMGWIHTDSGFSSCATNYAEPKLPGEPSSQTPVRWAEGMLVERNLPSLVDGRPSGRIETVIQTPSGVIYEVKFATTTSTYWLPEDLRLVQQ